MRMKMCQRIQSSVAISMAMSFVCFLSLASCRSYNNGLIFYDLKTFQPFLPPTVSVSRGRGLASVKFSEKGSIWSTFGKPCECSKNLCGCCAGINVKQYKFDQKMCANITFVPPKEEALLEVYLNDKPSSKYGISVRNPSPFCIPVMMGIPMAMCVQMSDIAIKGNNLNMCMDFIVRLATTDLFEMHFQCMQMGLDGFQYLDKDGNPVIPPSNSRDDASTDDDYYYYEADENEISYGISEPSDTQNEAQTTDTINALNTANDEANVANLQQQIHQLQSVQQYDIDKDDLLTQIDVEEEKTTLAPMVVEAESEPDFMTAITMAYGTAAEMENELKTETEPNTTTEFIETFESETTQATPTTIIAMSPVNDDYDNDAPSTNYNEEPLTTVVESVDNASLSTTTVKPVSKPIVAPTNAAYYDTSTDAATMTSKNIVALNTTAAGIEAVPLESFTTNYASNTTTALNATNEDIDFATTVAFDEDEGDTAAYNAAPGTATVAGIAIETPANNSTAQQDYTSDSEDSTETTVAALTSTLSTTTPPAVHDDAVDAYANNVVAQPEIPVASPKIDSSYPSYRRFFA